MPTGGARQGRLLAAVRSESQSMESGDPRRLILSTRINDYRCCLLVEVAQLADALGHRLRDFGGGMDADWRCAPWTATCRCPL